MYCPNCNYEYRDGITVCPDCGAELADRPAPEKTAEFDPDERDCIIFKAADEFEADVIIAKLRSEGIYAFKQFVGSDDYSRIILGRTILGVNIIVGENSVSKAREVLFG